MTAVYSQPRYWQKTPQPDIPATVTPGTIAIASRVPLNVSYSAAGEITTEQFFVDDAPLSPNQGSILDLSAWAGQSVDITWRATIWRPAGSATIEGTASSVAIPDWTSVSTLIDDQPQTGQDNPPIAGNFNNWFDAWQWLHFAPAGARLNISAHSSGVWQLTSVDMSNSRYIGSDAKSAELEMGAIVDGAGDTQPVAYGIRIDGVNDVTIKGGIWRNFAYGAARVYNTSNRVSLRHEEITESLGGSLWIDSEGSEIEVIGVNINKAKNWPGAPGTRDGNGLVVTKSDLLQVRQCQFLDNNQFGCVLTGQNVPNRITNSTIWHNQSNGNGDPNQNPPWGQGFLILSGPTNTDFQWNSADRNIGSGIQVEVSAAGAATTGGLIRNNTMTNNGNNAGEAGIWVKGFSGFETKDWVVEQNVCSGNPNGIIVGQHSDNTIVRNNLIVGNNAAFVRWNSEVGTQPNAVSSPSWGIFVYNDVQNLACYNNTLVDNGSRISNQPAASTNGSGVYLFGDVTAAPLLEYTFASSSDEADYNIDQTWISGIELTGDFEILYKLISPTDGCIAGVQRTSGFVSPTYNQGYSWTRKQASSFDSWVWDRAPIYLLLSQSNTVGNVVTLKRAGSTMTMLYNGVELANSARTLTGSVWPCAVFRKVTSDQNNRLHIVSIDDNGTLREADQGTLGAHLTRAPA